MGKKTDRIRRSIMNKVINKLEKKKFDMLKKIYINKLRYFPY